MKRFTEAVKEKWETAVVNLKEEMQVLQDENDRLKAEMATLKAGQPEGEDTVSIPRTEYAALMTAAASMDEAEIKSLSPENGSSTEMKVTLLASPLPPPLPCTPQI